MSQGMSDLKLMEKFPISQGMSDLKLMEKFPISQGMSGLKLMPKFLISQGMSFNLLPIGKNSPSLKECNASN